MPRKHVPQSHDIECRSFCRSIAKLFVLLDLGRGSAAAIPHRFHGCAVLVLVLTRRIELVRESWTRSFCWNDVLDVCSWHEGIGVVVFRGRERLVHQRTELVNALRATFYEFGYVCSQSGAPACRELLF